MSDFDDLEAELDALAAGLSPGPRARLARTIGTELRNANAQRIRANRSPDGAPMVPRKPRTPAPKTRSAKAAKMFQRAAGRQHLRTKATAEEVTVGFTGAAARILRIHHLGLRDRVSDEPGSPEVTYPARPLIGLTNDDRKRILDRVATLVA